MRWRKLRPAVQVVALLLFVVLMLAAGRGVLPADLFFRIDPLAGLAGMLAGRRLIPALLAGALIVLAGTLLLGRAGVAGCARSNAARLDARGKCDRKTLTGPGLAQREVLPPWRSSWSAHCSAA